MKDNRVFIKFTGIVVKLFPNGESLPAVERVYDRDFMRAMAETAGVKINPSDSDERIAAQIVYKNVDFLKTIKD